MKTSHRTLLCVLAWVLAGSAAVGQEFRVFTRVFDESAVGASQRPPVVVRSVSLFHANKVYDYVDGVGEVTIFDPVARQFTVIDGSGRRATVLAFDELKRMVSLAEEEAMRRAQSLSGAASSDAEEARELLAFLVQPEFQVRDDPANKVLYLTSPDYGYTVRYSTDVEPAFVESYLRYADWTARLNAVLHPHSLLPAPRLKLNELLRQKRVMPVEISLRVGRANPLKLRAEHQARWSLDRRDRNNIAHWEQLLQSRSLQFVSFPEYQRQLLLGKAGR